MKYEGAPAAGHDETPGRLAWVRELARRYLRFSTPIRHWTRAGNSTCPVSGEWWPLCRCGLHKCGACGRRGAVAGGCGRCVR